MKNELELNIEGKRQTKTKEGMGRKDRISYR